MGNIEIKKWLQQIWCKIKDLTNIHNELDGLQGGQEGQYYHLTKDQYDCLIDNCSNSCIGTWIIKNGSSNGSGSGGSGVGGETLDLWANARVFNVVENNTNLSSIPDYIKHILLADNGEYKGIAGTDIGIGSNYYKTEVIGFDNTVLYTFESYDWNNLQGGLSSHQIPLTNPNLVKEFRVYSWTYQGYITFRGTVFNIVVNNQGFNNVFVSKYSKGLNYKIYFYSNDLTSNYINTIAESFNYGGSSFNPPIKIIDSLFLFDSAFLNSTGIHTRWMIENDINSLKIYEVKV